MAEPLTSLHLLPEEAYPFTLAAFYRDDGVNLAWAVTFLSPRGANPMELSSVYIPPLKEWTGHNVEMEMCKPGEFFAMIERLIGG